jgi:Cof subfamily protein (haloacid dehalogenase superfamily)
MSKTLFVTDLDGTLLNSNAQITPYTAEIINKLTDEGLIFTYATARSYLTALKVIGGINFKYPSVHHNGVYIQNPKTGEYLEKCLFDKDIISPVIEKLCEHMLYPLVYAFIDGKERVSWLSGKETEGINFYLSSRAGDKRLRPVKSCKEFFDGGIYEICFFSYKSMQELQDILDILNLNEHFAYHLQQDTYKDEKGRTTYWLEIMRFDALKDEGVKKVKKLVGADKIVCFGDNLNDIPMFNISDEKYAVGNALPEVKAIATAVIGSNDDDGVAKWLEKNARYYLT